MLPSRRVSGMLPFNRGVLSEGNTSRRAIDRSVIAETGVIPAGMQLIRDTHQFQVTEIKNAIREGAGGRDEPVMRIAGLIQNGDTENANGRFYSTKEVLAPAVSNIQEDISNRAVSGEYDHPSDAKIHLDRLSHLMTKVWLDGKRVYGEAEVLHRLPCGAMLRGLFEHKVRVGISSRGVGDMEMMEHNGHDVYRVMPGYAFVTWDVVAEPSVSGAILNIQEGLVRRIKPLQQQKRLFSEDVYNNLLVKEIDLYFGLDKKRVTVPVNLSRTHKKR